MKSESRSSREEKSRPESPDFTFGKKSLTCLALVQAIMMAGAAQAAEPAAPAGAKPGGAATPAPKTTAKKPAPATDSEMDEVVVTAQTEGSYQVNRVSSLKYSEPLLDVPQTITVVPQAVIEDQNATTLRDVLRNVPGVSFQAGEGGVPAGDQLSIRGFSARTDIFIDGVRDVGGYSRDPFNIEQVEVSKGPASAYSGRGSTGGSVNLVTKTPKDHDFYEVQGSYGTNEYYRSTFDINQTVPQNEFDLGGVAFRLNGVFHSQDFAERDYVHDQRWGVAPSFTVGMGTPARATVSYMHLQQDNLPSYGLPFVQSSPNPYGGNSAVGKIAPVGRETFFGLEHRDYEYITTDIPSLKLEYDFSDNIRLVNQTLYARTNRDSVITAPRLVANAVPARGAVPFGMNRQIQSRDQLDEAITNQTTLETKFETWKLKHSLISAVEYDYERETNYLRNAPTLFTAGGTNFQAILGNPYNPNANDFYTQPVARTGAKNVAMADSVGISAFDTVEITEQWILNFGLRVDYFGLDYQSTAVNNTKTTLSNDTWEPTWRTGLVYKPVPYGSIYFGYGTSFNPSAENLTLAATNVDVEPETSESFELGTKWDLFQEKLSLTAAMFRTTKNNYRNTDPITGIVTNSGEVQVQGIEFGLAGNITKEWRVFGGYALMESDILKSSTLATYNGLANISEQGMELNNTPEQTASIWTAYELPYNIDVGTGFQFVDTRYANNINTNAAPGYWLQDFMLSWQANKNVKLQLNISNLWNENYIDRLGGGHAISGTGRSFVFSTALKF